MLSLGDIAMKIGVETPLEIYQLTVKLLIADEINDFNFEEVVARAKHLKKDFINVGETLKSKQKSLGKPLAILSPSSFDHTVDGKQMSLKKYDVFNEKNLDTFNKTDTLYAFFKR